MEFKLRDYAFLVKDFFDHSAPDSELVEVMKMIALLLEKVARPRPRPILCLLCSSCMIWTCRCRQESEENFVAWRLLPDLPDALPARHDRAHAPHLLGLPAHATADRRRVARRRQGHRKIRSAERSFG